MLQSLVFYHYNIIKSFDKESILLFFNNILLFSTDRCIIVIHEVMFVCMSPISSQTPIWKYCYITMK